MRSLLPLNTLLRRTILERDAREVFELLVELSVRGADECNGEGDDGGEEASSGDVEFEGERGAVLCQRLAVCSKSRSKLRIGRGRKLGRQGHTVIGNVCETAGADYGKSWSDCVANVEDVLPLLHGERGRGFEGGGYEGVGNGRILAYKWGCQKCSAYSVAVVTTHQEGMCSP